MERFPTYGKKEEDKENEKGVQRKWEVRWKGWKMVRWGKREKWVRKRKMV
jgi:hypothetical protein